MGNTHPPQGFCEIGGVGWFGGVLGGLDLVWESATPPTHIWERPPKKTFFFTPSLIATKKFQSKPICPRYSQCISLSQIEGWNLTGFQSWSLQPANKVVKAGEGGGRLTIQSQLWQIIFCQNTHLHFLVSPFEGGPSLCGPRGRARSKSILFAKYIKIYSPWYDVIVSIHSCLKHIDLKLFHHMGQQELAGWVPAPVHTWLHL